MKTRIVRNCDLAVLIDRVGVDELMDQAIVRLEAACREFDERQCKVRARDGFNYTEPYVGLIEWMPVMKVGSHCTIKIVGYHPGNPTHSQVPTILSTIGRYETATGHLSGLADGTFLTALRTAAASAVASKVLARPHSPVLGLVGAGAQAVTQLHALLRCFGIEKVLVCDIDPQAVSTLPARVAPFLPKGVELREAALDLLMQSSDIVCTATSVDVGRGPLFDDMETRPWLHVNAVGADFPGKTELPPSMLERSTVCPDFGEQAAREGECQQLDPAHVGPDLVELVQNSERYAAERERLTVFDSTGYALEDQVAMELLMDYADELGLGLDVQLEAAAGDPLNPYEFGADGTEATVVGVNPRPA